MGCAFSGELEIEADGRQYRLRKLIATGGFSQIYLGECLENGGDKGEKMVAVKKIACHSLADIERVVREVQFNRRFQHSSHVIRLLGVAEDELKLGPGGSKATIFALIFPLCRRGSVQDELARRKPGHQWIGERRVLRLFRQVCSALEVMHQGHPPVAHRDLKPGNLLFRDDAGDHLQLIDFGSAVECPVHIVDAQASRAMLDEAAEFCTMPYRAPELFTCEIGTTVDHRVDIWSLGCVLYALCYFCSPFDEVHERGDSVALAAQSARLNFAKDAPYRPELAQLISSLVKPDPGERPSVGVISARVDDQLLFEFSETENGVNGDADLHAERKKKTRSNGVNGS